MTLLFSSVLVAVGVPAQGQSGQPSSVEQDGAETNSAGNEQDGSAPYIVFVAESSAHARCGPGKQHYRTESLRRGQELEVYVETEAGWLGVRPPDDSFCWMPAAAVDFSDGEETATIIEDETKAWIGTNLGQARRYRWQVQLDAGEPVTIIGKTEREDTDGTKTWLRIVPPSGEFRWIHRDQIVESAEQLAEKLAADSATIKDTKNDLVAAIPALVPINGQDADGDQSSDSVNGSSVLQTGGLEGTDSMTSSRRRAATGTLREADEIPDLRPLSSDQARVSDKAIQFHRGANAEDFQDRGAVIGSGLKSEWKEDLLETDGEVLPASGAAAAAAVIAEPLKRMTDVVANFISPPRLVEINSGRANAFQPNANTSADRRWTVGSERTRGTLQPQGSLGMPSNLTMPASLAAAQPSQFQPEPALLPGSGVIQAAAIGSQTNGIAATGPSRTVPISQISRVEDAVKGADLDTAGHILSRLMAEGASSVELDPLIRRIDVLLQSGDVNRATRTRELHDRSRRYRDLAARRDGTTTIQSTVLATNAAPLLPPSRQPAAGRTITNQATARQATAPVSSQTIAIAQSAGQATVGRQLSTQPVTVPLGPVAGTATGYLVQVYSSRANSPPYALTDDAGLTIAYVTPYPGVNLRNHLNSRIAVRGNEKMLQGMNMPHILVDQAIRR